MEEKHRKLFIVGLPQEAKRNEIEAYFKKFGGIEELRIIMDKSSNTSRGFGFVLFKQKDSLHSVLELGEFHNVGSYEVSPGLTQDRMQAYNAERGTQEGGYLDS